MEPEQLKRYGDEFWRPNLPYIQCRNHQKQRSKLSFLAFGEDLQVKGCALEFGSPTVDTKKPACPGLARVPPPPRHPAPRTTHGPEHELDLSLDLSNHALLTRAACQSRDVLVCVYLNPKSM